MRRSTERELFERRAALPAPAPPAFADVLARARRRERPTAWQRLSPRLGLAAAAAIAGLFLAKSPPATTREHRGEITITAEPLGDLTCVESPPAEAARDAEGVIAGLESDYHACLVATPSVSPRQARIDVADTRAPDTHDHQGDEIDVTCGCPGPSEDEASAEAACEGSHR